MENEKILAQVIKKYKIEEKIKKYIFQLEMKNYKFAFRIQSLS